MTVNSALDYWMSPTALTLTLNALGEPNRVQGAVVSGAVIAVWRSDVPGEAEGGPAGNGDGLGYGADYQPRRWPLTVSPTWFNSNTAKWVYAAVPRSAGAGSQAVVVFPSEQLDLWGRNAGGEQVGSTDWFYIWLQGIISATDGTEERRWTAAMQSGKLETAQGQDERMREQDWYSYSPVTQVVTLLKRIVMDPASSFANLNLNDKTLTDVATALLDAPVDSDEAVATPGYVSKFYLSKVHDDTAAGKITFRDVSTFQQGLIALAKAVFGSYLRGDTNTGAAILPNGTGDFLNLKVIGKVLGNLTVEQTMEAVNVIFSGILQSADAREGFENGKGIWMDAVKGLIQTDGMEVRGFLRVMELIINRLQLMESDYSFTEGDTITHIDYEDYGQTLVLTMDKEHDTDYTPFYVGDIIYAKTNDLLPRDGSVPDGHTVTKNGSYYTTWAWADSIDLAENKIRVHLYPGLKANGNPYVPGSKNFSFHGTMLSDSDVTAEMLEEYNTVGTDYTAGEIAAMGDKYKEGMRKGYDCRIAITRHGNVGNSSDEHIRQSQMGRQQSWVLSTTDQRITYFWRVDEPIVSDDNYALCLGILPDLDCLPNNIRNRDLPSLFVNTIFYSHMHKVNWPAKVVKEDRGAWSATPAADYEGTTGTWTADGTLSDESLTQAVADGQITQADADFLKTLRTWGGSVTGGSNISEPYHFKTITRATWLTYRLSGSYQSESDLNLYRRMTCEWTESVDLEVSRVWNGGKLWECLVDNPSQTPQWGSTQWQVTGGNQTYVCEITTSEGAVFRGGNVDTLLAMSVTWGDEDVTAALAAAGTVVWKRYTSWSTATKQWEQTAEDLLWTATPQTAGDPTAIAVVRSDMGTGWMIDYRRAMFECNITADDVYSARFITAI
jgi:hypothetical protein